jgi:hypothetical protein
MQKSNAVESQRVGRAGSQSSARDFSKPDGAQDSHLSSEIVDEQRKRNIEWLDYAFRRTRFQVNKALSSTHDDGDKLDELKKLRKSMKRKSISGDEVSGDLVEDKNTVNKAFIAMDRQILLKLRADEFPVQTRSTVLNAPTMVYSSL